MSSIDDRTFESQEQAKGSYDPQSEEDRETILQVEDAQVQFDMERGTSTVLDNVSIDIQRQEILGVVGESGSGKSMFASALLDAVVKPGVLTGEITYYPGGGEPVDVLDLDKQQLKQLRWEEISMVFQGAMSSFNPTMDIRGHFEETIREHDQDIEERMDHAHELLSELYLDPERVLDSYPHELSGGMKQRALIALSLILDPEVLVMDEPTAALDLLMQRSILSLLDNLKDMYDLTVVFITHDLPLVAGLADRLCVMYAFDFVEVGPSTKLLESPAHPYTRALFRAVPNLNAPLADMEPIEGSAPDPVNVPSGCSYHPRCPLADERCRTVDPQAQSVDENHDAACFYWEDARESIPIYEEGDRGEVTQVAGQQSDEPVVSMEDLTVHFEQQGEGGLLDIFSDPDLVHAVDGVDLDIYENDVVALVGESGCGKTTLGKAAIGAQRPTDGTVNYRGEDIWEVREGNSDSGLSYRDIRKSLQMVHQDPGSSLNPNRTVESTLLEPLKRWYPDLGQNERRERIMAALMTVGMEPPKDYANRYPHQLSGGEKQRVALIRALLMNPDLILADEAVSALDVSLRIEMMDLMLELQEMFNTSYLFISHNFSNARYLAGRAGGRIGVMYLGELVEIGPAEEIISNPQHPYTKVLMWSTADLKAEEEIEEPPIRGIDIPDPVNPPSGCRFHTRCPEAREVCSRESPSLVDDEASHPTACFREYGTDHEYWDSAPLEDEEAEISTISSDN